MYSSESYIQISKRGFETQRRAIGRRRSRRDCRFSAPTACTTSTCAPPSPLPSHSSCSLSCRCTISSSATPRASSSSAPLQKLVLHGAVMDAIAACPGARPSPCYVRAPDCVGNREPQTTKIAVNDGCRSCLLNFRLELTQSLVKHLRDQVERYYTYFLAVEVRSTCISDPQLHALCAAASSDVH